MGRLSSGAWLAVASAVCYGWVGVFAKLAYGEGWNVPTLLTARFLFASLFVLPFALRGGGSWRGWWAGFAVGALGFAATTALYFPAVALLPAAVASFLLYLSPVIVTLAGWLLLGEHLRARGWIALGLAVAGLVLLAAGAFDGTLSPLGVALASASALTWAATVIASKRLTATMPWARATLAVCVGTLSSYLVFSLATRQLSVPPSWAGVAYAFGLGTIATGAALALFMAALARIGASRTSVISTLEPVSTLIIAAIVLAELPTALGIAGGLLIVAAAALVAVGEDPSRGDNPDMR